MHPGSSEDAKDDIGGGVHYGISLTREFIESKSTLTRGLLAHVAVVGGKRSFETLLQMYGTIALVATIFTAFVPTDLPSNIADPTHIAAFGICTSAAQLLAMATVLGTITIYTLLHFYDYSEVAMFINYFGPILFLPHVGLIASIILSLAALNLKNMIQYDDTQVYKATAVMTGLVGVPTALLWPIMQIKLRRTRMERMAHVAERGSDDFGFKDS